MTKKKKRLTKRSKSALKDEKTQNLWKRDRGGKWVKAKKKVTAA